ncbi:MAG: hypothetical protein U9R25_11495 [Chloroflexota bacterium]|nr:hypothetical protein [Chloroflexota bacterium]
MIIVTLLLGATVQVAAAASPPDSDPREYSLHCEDGVCSVEVDFEQASGLARFGTGALMNFIKDQDHLLPSGTNIELQDDLMLALPVGNLPLSNADVALELGENNEIERLHGTTEVSFPSLGIFDNIEFLKPVVADIGLERGEHLGYVDADLLPERQYLIFRFGTGFDMEARLPGADGAARSLGLSIPADQNATLVIDTEDPLVYLLGNLSIRHNGPVAFVDGIFDEGLADALDALPQRTALRAEGVLTDDLDEAYIELGAGHSVDSGLVGDWLNLDVMPIAVEGMGRLSQDGLLVHGIASSSIEPEVVWDGNLELEAFIPFSEDAPVAYVIINGDAAIPVANSTADVTAEWSAGDQLVIVGVIDSPFAQTEITMTPSVDLDGIDPAAAPAAVARFVGNLAQGAADGAGQGWDWVSGASQGTWGWVSDNASDGYAAVSGFVESKTD